MTNFVVNLAVPPPLLLHPCPFTRTNPYLSKNLSHSFFYVTTTAIKPPQQSNSRSFIDIQKFKANPQVQPQPLSQGNRYGGLMPEECRPRRNYLRLSKFGLLPRELKCLTKLNVNFLMPKKCVLKKYCNSFVFSCYLNSKCPSDWLQSDKLRNIII